MVETEHRPFVLIVKKTLAPAPAILQRILLQLHGLIPHRYFSQSSQGYTEADALSNKFLSDTYPYFSDSMDAFVHSVMSSIPINNMRLDETRAIMSADPRAKAHL